MHKLLYFSKKEGLFYLLRKADLLLIFLDMAMFYDSSPGNNDVINRISDKAMINTTVIIEIKF